MSPAPHHNDSRPSLVVLAAGMARRYGGVKPLAPIGPHGEAVLDLLVGDAIRAGFGRIVLVLHPETGPAIRYHVEQTWPEAIDVGFATQRLPLGTVHAVLAAEDALHSGTAFGVCNADDVYGEAAMATLVNSLTSAEDAHVLVGFPLRSTIATDDPVTRGICAVDDDGWLTSLDERRQVRRQGDDFVSEDGRQPVALSGDQPASVNLWGFQPSIWPVFHEAMDGSGLDEEALIAQVKAGGAVPKAEVLLPEIIATMVSKGRDRPVRVLATVSHLVGVTHASDLPVVSAELARQVAFGVRPDNPWADVG